MVDSRTLHRDSIRIGLTVKIALNNTQKPQNYIKGIVQEILSQVATDDNGIEVELLSGYIGRVKEIIDESTSEQIELRILSRENERVERKETFAFDVRKNCKNNNLKKAVVYAIVSLLNSYGGYVYIGVHDNGIVRGLRADYSDGGDNDELERKIRDTLEKYLADYVLVSRLINISFPVIFNHEICEIEVHAAPEPIFIKPTDCYECTDGKKVNRKIDEFYIRDGNQKKLIDTKKDFVTYYKTRFLTNNNN